MELTALWGQLKSPDRAAYLFRQFLTKSIDYPYRKGTALWGQSERIHEVGFMRIVPRPVQDNIPYSLLCLALPSPA